MKFHVYLLTFLLVLTSFKCKQSSEAKPSKLLPSNITDLVYPYPVKPILSAHRGGKHIIGYPENCLETFQYITGQYDFILEFDVVQSSDSVLYLMHDNSLERTTNGSGSSFDQAWSYISGLHLKDNEGSLTSFKVPRLEDVLQWADGKVLLSIDVKRGVDRDLLLNLLYQYEAYRFAEIITYTIDDVNFYKNSAPEFTLSVNVRNDDELERVLDTGILLSKVKPFIGTSRKSSDFIQKLHERGWLVTLGTLGNLDAQAQARGFHIYNELIVLGVDAFATDYPLEVAEYFYNN